MSKQLIKPVSEEVFNQAIKGIADDNHQARVNAFTNNGILSLRVYLGVSRYKSIRRSIRRGLVSLYGDMYPKRPFSNRKRGKGTATYNRRRVYGQWKNYD
jgi:hypothetical protein